MSQFQKTEPFPEELYTRILKQVYLQNPEVMDLYPNAGPEADWASQIELKSTFSPQNRAVLVQELLNQYGDLATDTTQEQIQSLGNSNTFTVTTGQQIHIFLGPLYLVYKALSTIALANELKQKFPNNHFVPIFWMASEDHDFDEINHVTVFNKGFTWEAPNGGPVGRISTQGIHKVIAEIKAAFPNDEKVAKALEIYEIAYSRFENLSDATRYLLHELLGHQGLIVIDADATAFKQQFALSMLQDAMSNTVGETIYSQTVKMKKMGLETSISGRSTNLFILVNGQRRRLDRGEEGFRAKDEDMVYSETELRSLITTTPEMFSPNVALRPVYQETILPNLCYIAGPGEFTYWFQLAQVFSVFSLPRPVLLPRHSFIVADSKSQQWLNSKGISVNMMLKDDTAFRQNFLEVFAGQSPMPELIGELQKINAKISEYLYSVKSSELKGVKKMGEGYENTLNKVHKEILNSLIDNEKYVQEWQKSLKLREKLFSTINPQERKSYFLEMSIQNRNFLDAFVQIPDVTKSPHSVLWLS